LSGYQRFMSRETMYVLTAPWIIYLEKETDVQQIKYLRVPDEIIDQVSESQKGQQGGFRGGRGGQSRGDHSGRGDRGRGRGGRGRGRGRGQ
jgi:hypothetical protein